MGDRTAECERLVRQARRLLERLEAELADLRSAREEPRPEVSDEEIAKRVREKLRRAGVGT